MVTINMLGKPCPLPLVEAKKALSHPDCQGVTVLVDNIIAVQNLEKMAAELNYGFSFTQIKEAEYAAAISVNEKSLPAFRTEQISADSGVTYLFTADQIGISDPVPGQVLMKSFLIALVQAPNPPESVLLINTAVKMAAVDADVLNEMQTLSKCGTKILLCGQCVTYYELTDNLAVGRVTNMLEILEVLTAATRAITL